MIGKIAFNDLAAQRARISDRLDAAVRDVIERGEFILGPQVAALERELEVYTGASHCITCANGTDALVLSLMALGIGRGDAVFVPAFTFVATAEAVRLVGAVPVFCDVLKDSFNLDSTSLGAAISQARAMGLKPRAIMPVDLFGQPADYRRLGAIADEFGLEVIADAAQSFGASLDNRRVGTFGTLTTTSFFPAKPLGCYGDGGAIFTQNAELAELLRSLRFHGRGSDKYDNIRIGLNSRLDTIQAAILLVKLSIFDDEIAARRQIAQRYSDAFEGLCFPRLSPGATSVWAQYTLVVDDRKRFAAGMAEAGIPTAVYYPIPLSRQTGYRDCPVAQDGVPQSEWLAEHVISLPMHAYLDEATQEHIIATVRRLA